MSLIFPSSASIGQIYISGSSTTYRWTGTYWETLLPSSHTVATAATASYINTEYGEAVLATNINLSTSTTTDIISFTLPSTGVYETTYLLNVECSGSNVQDSGVFFFTNNSNTLESNTETYVETTSNTNMSGMSSTTAFLIAVGPTTYKVRGTRSGGILAVYGQSTGRASKVVWKKVG